MCIALGYMFWESSRNSCLRKVKIFLFNLCLGIYLSHCAYSINIFIAAFIIIHFQHSLIPCNFNDYFTYIMESYITYFYRFTSSAIIVFLNLIYLQSSQNWTLHYIIYTQISKWFIYLKINTQGTLDQFHSAPLFKITINPFGARNYAMGALIVRQNSAQSREKKASVVYSYIYVYIYRRGWNRCYYHYPPAAAALWFNKFIT